jgi:hypothetical protein
MIHARASRHLAPADIQRPRRIGRLPADGLRPIIEPTPSTATASRGSLAGRWGTLAWTRRPVRRALALGLAAVVVGGCASSVAIADLREVAGEWRGRVSSPLGNGLAAMAVRPDGRYAGTIYLDGGDRAFHGAMIVVRPGDVRYQGSDGNGTVRLVDERQGRVLKFLRDGGGIDAVFTRP